MSRIVKNRTEGIDLALALAGDPAGDNVLRGQYGILEQHRTLVGPQGQPLIPSSATRRALDCAYAEGFIAAYRTATEF